MFELPDVDDDDHDPACHYEKLVERCDEHAHLKAGEPSVAFLFRLVPEVSQGRAVIGTCYMPSVQGRLSKVFEWLLEDKLGYTPDFLFILDKDWWEQASPLEREILVFHEMMHAGQAEDKFGSPRFHRESGLPVWCIKGHDVEEFTATVARYGAWAPEIKKFIEAAKTGEASV